MTKTELIQRLSERYPGCYKTQLEKAVDTIFAEISRALAKGDRIELRDFGSFFVKLREARKGRNPRTGESVLVDAKYKVHFKTGRALRYGLNGGKVSDKVD